MAFSDVAAGQRFSVSGPSGSGRTISLRWPQTPGDQTSTNMVSRVGGLVAGASEGLGGAGSVYSSVNNGVECIGLRSTGAVADQVNYSFAAPGPFSPRRDKGPSVTPDPYGCWRFVAVLQAFVAPVLDDAHDFGLEVVYNASANVLAAAGKGVACLLAGAGVVNHYVRGPNGLIKTVLNTGLDLTQFNTYEHRFEQATANSDMRYGFYINGNAQPLAAATQNGGAGSNLPPSAIGGFRNYKSTIFNQPGATGVITDLIVASYDIFVGTTFNDTL